MLIFDRRFNDLGAAGLGVLDGRLVQPVDLLLVQIPVDNLINYSRRCQTIDPFQSFPKNELLPRVAMVLMVNRLNFWFALNK